MRSLVIKIKESAMTKVVPKLLEKRRRQKEVVKVEEGMGIEDIHKDEVKIFMKQSQLLLKKSIMVRLPKLQ